MPEQQQVVTSGYEYIIPKERERFAGSAIKVGALLGFDGNGDLVPHASATTGTEVTRVANAHINTGIARGSLGTRTNYEAGELVKWFVPVAGAEVLLNLAESQTIADGDALVPAGTAGQVRLLDTAGGDTADMIVGEAVPGIDQSKGFSMTTAAGEVGTITVEVI